MIQAICWVLIHSLWQGLLFTVATGLVMLRTKKMSAALRYNLLTGMFFLFLAGCGVTFLYEWRLSQLAGPVDLLRGVAAGGGGLCSFIGTLNAYFSANASLIVLGWFLIFFSKCIRMTGSLLYTQRIRHYGTSEAPAGWNDKVVNYCGQLGITKKVALLQSRLVKMPVTAGHWKPVILIPLGLLTQLPEGEIEAMLLHELAHIRRHDYLVNICQHIAENIFFFNPGLLWISALLREEREHCCDDMAIEKTNNKIQFIQALINFKEHDLRAAGLANAFTARKNQLLHRVLRIAQNKHTTLSSGEKIFLLASFLVVTMLVFAGGREETVAVGSVHQMVLGKKDKIIISRNEGGLPLEAMRAYLRGETKGADNGADGTSDNGADHANHVDHAESAAARQARVQSRVLPQPVRPVTAIKNIAGPDLSPVTEKDLAWNDRAPAEMRQDRLQIDHAKTQHEKDAEQAVRDRLQGEKDRAQAVRDREQSELDRQQSERDREQVVKDKLQAVKDQEQAQKDREQAVKDRAQAEIDRKQADKDRAQAILDRKQADKDREQARIDRAEAEKKRTNP